MKTEHKEQAFIKVEKKIKMNQLLILIFKALTPVFMTLFVVIAFYSFYTSIIEMNNEFITLYKSVLVFLFGALALFHFTINKKEKENIRINSTLCD